MTERQKMYNCSEAVHRLYEYIDQELDHEAMAEVEKHLEKCPPCRDVFFYEENVLRLVGECARKVRAPEDLVERVRTLSRSADV